MSLLKILLILFFLSAQIFSMNAVSEKIGADYYHDRGNYGQGCIVGLFDPSSYIDITNSVFRNPDGSTRFIYYFWTSLFRDSDTLEYNREDLDSILSDYTLGSGRRWAPFDTSSASYDTTYNGSHPLSTLFCAAGGDFIKNDTVYHGIAPQADLVYFSYGDISECVRKLDSLSKAHDKPFVFATVNAAAVAWNIDTLTGAGIPGKAAFLPTGNSNEIDYMERDVSTDDPLTFSFPDMTPAMSSEYSHYFFGAALWIYDENILDSMINVEITMPDGETYVFPENSSAGRLLDAGGNVFINSRRQNFNTWANITAPDSALDSNQHWSESWHDSTISMIAIDDFYEDTLSVGFYEDPLPCVYMEIAYLGDSITPFQIKAAQENTGSASFMKIKFNEMRYLTNTVACCAEDYYYYKPGGLTSKYSMTPSAWPEEGIACGAYIYRDRVPDSLDRIAPFSGVGPSPQGLMKPDIVGPGTKVNILWVDNLYQDPYIYSTDGTSLSTPVAAGAAALLLTENPTLSAPQIKQIFRERADTAGISDEVPGNVFGWGRLYVSPEPVLSKKKPVADNSGISVNRITVSANRISIHADRPFKKIRVYNPKGRMVTSLELDKSKKDAVLNHSLSSGMYLFEIINRKGSVIRKTEILSE